MKGAGVQRVVDMLSDSELQTYAESLPEAMKAAFGEGKYTNINAKAPGKRFKPCDSNFLNLPDLQ